MRVASLANYVINRDCNSFQQICLKVGPVVFFFVPLYFSPVERFVRFSLQNQISWVIHLLTTIYQGLFFCRFVVIL